MRINPIQLKNKSKLIVDYRNNKEEIMGYFDYSPFEPFKKRLEHITDRTYNRQELVKTLQVINSEWDASKETLNQLNKLNDEESVVVIGGQQAGLATGPLYTINKVISIIQLARQQEAALNIPVIPVFWIAGEDHDYDEINHVYMECNNEMKKNTFEQQQLIKKSISHIELNKEQAEAWIKQLFLQLQETVYTKDIYEQVQFILEKSNTFVDFFARIILHLFKDDGLVLIDSGHPSVRSIESDMFVSLIKNQHLYAENVFKNIQTLNQKGYPIAMDAESDDAHLFYHDNRQERILLKKGKDNMWTGKNEEVIFTTEEMLSIAQNTPERLSNNVVTRPIMQEYLFPTLAFVGGDGEISYWAALKDAFHVFGYRVPPVVPRLSFTYVNAKVKGLLTEKGIKVEDAINCGVGDLKINWLNSQHTSPIETLVAEVKKEIKRTHLPLREVAGSISEDLNGVAERNLEFIFQDLNYLENKITQTLNEKYKNDLTKYDYIDNQLRPNGTLQERVWNPLPLMNDFGRQFIKELVNCDLSFNNDHYIVWL